MIKASTASNKAAGGKENPCKDAAHRKAFPQGGLTTLDPQGYGISVNSTLLVVQ